MKNTDNTNQKYVFQDLDWFKENAFVDIDGDFWRHQKDAKRYDVEGRTGNDTTGDNDEIIYTEDVGKVFDEEDLPTENIEWAIKMIVAKETHPEYWL